MSTAITSLARLAGFAQTGFAGFARFARRRRRAALLASVPLLAVGILAAGCGTVSAPPVGGGGTGGGSGTGNAATSSPPSVSSTPVPTSTGGPVAPGEPACVGWPQHPALGPLPASFVPVAVLRCVNGYQTIPGKGQWLTATLERAGRDLAPLVAALRRSPEHTAPGRICPAIAVLPPQIALISGDGKDITPRIPLGGCGLVQPQVLAALAALPWQRVSVRLVSQVQTQQEVASGCQPGFKDPFAVYGSPRPSPGGAVFPARTAALQICVYSSGGAANAAQFARSATVSGPAERELLAGLSAAGRASQCALPHSRFAVVQSPGAPLVYVELGGCDRVLRYEPVAGGMTTLATGQATPGAVAAIESLTRP
jgi:hypothetical protein